MAKKIAYCGILSSLALIIGYLERIIPFPAIAPGMKPGFANIVILIAIYTVPKKDAFIILVLKVLLTGILFSGPSGFLYSAAGALLSFAVMLAFKSSDIFGIVGISVLGGVFHNFGQIITAVLILNTPKLLYYFPVLIISGIATGIITGMIAGYTLKHLRVIHNS